MPRSAREAGAAVSRAEERSRNIDYPDIHASPQIQLLSLGVETYGRWSDHSLVLMRHLAQYKSSNMPEYLRASIEQGCFARWWSLVSITVQQAVAERIIKDAGHDLQQAGESNGAVPIEEFFL